MCKAAFRILKKLRNQCILCSCSTLQVFDSNVNKDKLLRLKLGSGKVIKVQLLALSLQLFKSQSFELLQILFRNHTCHFCFIYQEALCDSDSLRLCTIEPSLLLNISVRQELSSLVTKETSCFQELGFYCLCFSGSHLIHSLGLGEPYF